MQTWEHELPSNHRQCSTICVFTKDPSHLLDIIRAEIYTVSLFLGQGSQHVYRFGNVFAGHD